MKHIINYITEKLRLSKDLKIQSKPSISKIDIPWRLDAHFNIYSDKQKDDCMNRMDSYYTKQFKVNTLINSLKDSTKLVNRWYCAVLLEWDEAIQKIGKEIEKRNIATVDQLSAYLYRCYNKTGISLEQLARQYITNIKSGSIAITEYKQHLEHYFDLYNIDY